MAIIGLQKGSGKRLRVREKSVKSQGILIWIMSGNPEGRSGTPKTGFLRTRLIYKKPEIQNLAVNNKGADQTGRMDRLILAFHCSHIHKTGFLMTML